jgi:hypothetical protein
MEMKNRDRSLSRRQEESLLKAADAVARTEFDNPIRTGCPDSEALNLLARRDSSFPETPDLVDHIGTCSPCFVEYSRFRTAYKHRIRMWYVCASAALVVSVCVVAALLLHEPTQPPMPDMNIARLPEASQTDTKISLDLRMRGTFRTNSPDQGGTEPPLRLPRARLSVSILLPIGSEDGSYDIALIGAAGRTLLKLQGVARRENFVEVLPVKLGLSHFSPGHYELRLRRENSAWSAYPVLIE